MDLKSFIALTRIEHGFIIIIAVLVGAVIVSQFTAIAIPAVPLALACISGLFIQMGAFVINDYLDIEADKANKRTDRPLANGSATKKQAEILFCSLFIFGVICAGFVNILCLVIAFIFTMLSLAYSFNLKKVALAGNAIIGASTAIPFFFGTFVLTEDIPLAILVLAGIAFLSTIGRELMLAVKDMRGDKQQGRRTLPIVIGARNTTYVLSCFLLAAIALSLYPYLYLPLYLNNLYYLIPVLIANALWVYGIYLVFKLKGLKKMRKLTLGAYGFGIIGFLLGVLL